MVRRNDPCPCGSGKKYKRCCHGNNEEFIEQQVEAGLRQTLVDAYEQFGSSEDLTAFAKYMMEWKEKLGDHWTNKGIEESISAYFLFVERRELWQRYLSTALNETLRTEIRAVLETWQNPIILLGHILAEQDGIFEIEQLLDGETVYLKKSEDELAVSGSIVYGVVLPDNRKRQNGLYVISPLLFVKNEHGIEAVKSFAEANGFGQNPNFFNKHMIDLYEILLGKHVEIAKEITAEQVEEIVREEAPVESNDESLTPIQQEAIDLLKSTLVERGADIGKHQMLENVCIAYFAKDNPNFRKANVVAAGVFRAAIDLELLEEESMTNGAVAQLFDISPASMSRHAEAVRELIPELYPTVGVGEA